jgi:hypothetical protein
MPASTGSSPIPLPNRPQSCDRDAERSKNVVHWTFRILRALAQEPGLFIGIGMFLESSRILCRIRTVRGNATMAWSGSYSH